MSGIPDFDSGPRVPGVRSVEARTTIRVADQLVAILRNHGIDRVFGIPGGTISPFFDALLGTDVEVVCCQHETMAVFAAAGYARAVGRPAVVAVTSGPGLLNALTGIASATLDESAVLVLAGEVATASSGRGALQDGGPAGLDVGAMVRPITRYAETLARPERAVAMLEQALATIARAPRGAAVLRLPVDVLQSTERVCEVSLPAPEAMTLAPHTARRIAGMLSAAPRPALMLGVGARSSATARRVLALAEWLRCPVFCDVEGKGVFPESHPLCLGGFGVGAHGRATTYLEQGIDLLVTVGARLDDTTTSGYSELLTRPRAIVQLDHDASRLHRAFPGDVAVCADIPATLEQIHTACPMPSMETIRARDRMLRSLPAPSTTIAPMDAPPFDPRSIAHALQLAFGPDAIFVCDIGNHMMFSAQTLVIDRPDGFFVSLGLGSMGSGVGHAIGLQLAHGWERQVVAIVGDGGLHMAGNELATCVELGLPLVVAVFNDGQLGMVAHGDGRVFGRARRWQTPASDIAAYARSLGASAERIQSYAQLAKLGQAELRGPVVLDIPIDGTIAGVNPREAGFGVATEISA